MEKTEELIDLIDKSKIIVMVGPPCAGKTTLAEALKKIYKDCMFIHSDDYIQYGYKESVYKMLEDINKAVFNKIIIEGIQTARLLRKGVELENFYCDLIIKFEIPLSELEQRYVMRENKHYPIPTLKALNTVWLDYLERGSHVIPTIHRITQ